MRKQVTRRIINTVCAFAAGVFTLPLALVIYPAFIAWFAWSQLPYEEGGAK